MRYEVIEAQTTKEKATLEIYLTKFETELIILNYIAQQLEQEGRYSRSEADKVKIRSGKGRGWEVIIEVRPKTIS